MADNLKRIGHMNHCDTVIFACSSLKGYVSAAQEKEGTCYPVVFLDKENHIEPRQMKQCILAAEKELPGTRVAGFGFVFPAFCDSPGG